MDRASAEAANSLLKTLEEPPAHVVLILTAAHPEALPSTVVSRCQRIDLRPVAPQVLESALIERGVPPAEAHLLARLSGGRAGWALAASDDDAMLRQRQQDLDQMLELLTASRVERLDFAWQASRDQSAALRLLASWTGWWRDLLLLCGRGEGSVANVDRLDELRLTAQQSSLPQAWMTLKALQATEAQLEANVNPRLALEGMLLKLPHHLPLRELQAGHEKRQAAVSADT
jgi:DNA polymerase-3 subunit delta'